MSEESEGEGRQCPYCGKILYHPYWQHVQEKHPVEYEQNETWVQLYKDYSSMGMDKSMCLMVISELFNAPQTDVESYLKKRKAL